MPEVGSAGSEYSVFLESLPDESNPKFMNHYYNFYFAHTAGGRMIGRKMADALLEGKELEFYRWRSDVKGLLGAVSKDIDRMAATWSREEKDECLEETSTAFKLGGAMLKYLK